MMKIKRINYTYIRQRNKVDTHKNFLHYTNLNSLAHILKSKALRLSRLDKVNDPAEDQRVDQLCKGKIYVFCFTHIEKESIPLWKMYADSEMGLCLVFDNIDFLEDKEKYERIDRGWLINNVKLLDVLYVDNPEEYVTEIHPFGEDAAGVPRPTCLGFLKTQVWEFEKETRVRCYINVDEGNLSIKKRDERKRGESIYKCPDFEYVYCKIPDEVLFNMKIIFNPFMDEIQVEIVKAIVKNYLPDFDDNNFVISSLKGKIK